MAYEPIHDTEIGVYPQKEGTVQERKVWWREVPNNVRSEGVYTSSCDWALHPEVSFVGIHFTNQKLTDCHVWLPSMVNWQCFQLLKSLSTVFLNFLVHSSQETQRQWHTVGMCWIKSQRGDNKNHGQMIAWSLLNDTVCVFYCLSHILLRNGLIISPACQGEPQRLVERTNLKTVAPYGSGLRMRQVVTGGGLLDEELCYHFQSVHP